MRKEVYLVKGVKNETYQNFSDRIILLATSISNEKDTEKLKITYTKFPPPKIAVIPFKNEKIAAISVYRSKTSSINYKYNDSEIAGAYAVEEAIPVCYKKNWDDLIPTPGVCLLTLFRKKESIGYSTFLNRWHNRHTPLSLKIHPLWNYNRNVAIQDLSGSDTKWDGIVEEQFRTDSELLNPLKFFGNPFIMIINMIRVFLDTISFIEYKSIEPYFATEIHIKS